MMSDAKVTAVLLAYRKNRLNHRLVFGTPAFEVRRGWHRKFAVFEAGNIFGYERWRGNKYGTQDWSFAVCETVGAGSFSKIPGVIPGANLLLQARGKTRVKRALKFSDALKLSNSNLETVPILVWRTLHLRLVTGQKEAHIIEELAQGFPC